jgi:hypothetical protein
MPVGEQNGYGQEPVLSQNLAQSRATTLTGIHDHAFGARGLSQHEKIGGPRARREPGDEHDILHQVAREP